MSDKKTISRHTKIIAISVICLTLITISTSYASIFSIKTNSSAQTITSGTLSVQYGGESTSINSGDMLPMSDAEGLNQTTSSLLYVQNNGNIPERYTITVSYDYNSFSKAAGHEDGDRLVPLEYLKMAIYEYNTTNSQLTQIGSVMNLGDLPVYSIDTNDQYNNKYSILTGSLKESGVSGSNTTYAVKVWLDETASDCINGYYVYLKVDVNAEPLGARMSYNLNTKVLNSSGTAVSGAKVSFLNSANVTTDANGLATINSISEGSYLVKVTTTDNTVYSGTLKVNEGSAVSISKYATTHTAQAGNNISSLAYTYATTPLRVKDANSGFTLDTLNQILTTGNTYNIPSSYLLTGGSSESVGTLNIKLGTNKDITEFSIS